ncbi:MAG: DUF421 domain-containing protein [Streptosporangiaceae bacterium]
MWWLTGHWNGTWAVAVKAVLLYATALAGLRLGARRTLAQMAPFDFVTAVAMGAIIGRTATAIGTSYVQGAVAVVTLIAAHRVVSLLRFYPAVRRVTDHRIRILADHGRIRRRQLWVCGLTESDLWSELRQQGIASLDDVRLVLYERAGGLTVVPATGGGRLVDDAVAAAAEPPGR